MNLFVLNTDPVKAAQLQANKHVVKMPTETANMLLWPHKLIGAPLPKAKSGEIIRLSHENHPATKWILRSSANYEWALTHLKGLCDEYKKRYKNTHYAENYLDYCEAKKAQLNFCEHGLTPFARCFGSFAEVIKDERIEIAYQQFYIKDKYDFAKWPSIWDIPAFWPSNDSRFVDESFENGVYTKR